jgi:hypothetical protein
LVALISRRECGMDIAVDDDFDSWGNIEASSIRRAMLQAR